jgi:ferric-dicitrate binding protein FerR (iron transport regulator)
MTDHQTPDADLDTDLEVAQLIRRAGTRPVPGADRAGRVRAAVEREWRAQTRARHTRRWATTAVAMLAVAATVFLAVRQRETVAPPATPPVPVPIATVAAAHGAVTTEMGGALAIAVVGHTIAAGSSIRTDGTSRATVTLADRGEIRIDANSSVTLVDARTIQLDRGAIYIDSGASTPGSFTVRTASGTVRDIGTRFEVRLLRQGRSDGDLRIRVRDGAVQLEHAGRIDRASRGTELLARPDGTVSTSPVDPFAADWAWTTEAAPTFIVENATLESFLQWAAREGGWTLDWSDTLRQRARTTTLHGAIDGMTPAEALEAVLPPSGLSPQFIHGRLRLRPIR